MNLKGQKVYVVNVYDSNGDAIEYEVFADVADANKAVAKAERKGADAGETAYWTEITIS